MKNHKELRWNLSFEPGYQLIYWSLCWLSFFVGLIAWLEYTRFNWVTVVFWIITLLFIALAKTYYLSLVNQELCFFFLSNSREQVPLQRVAKVTYSTHRLIGLYDEKGNEIKQIFLNKKNRHSFLKHVSTQYPTIEIEENPHPLYP